MPLAAEDFSYAAPTDPWLKRTIIHGVEWLTGAPYLGWLYEDFLRYPPKGETLWDSGVRRLELDVRWDAEKLAAWPKTGPLVVVCNHPFGVMDGLVACHVVAKARPDFRVLANAVLMRAEEIREHLLPIDFDETKVALETNLKSRAEAKAHLENGGCLLIFPSGAVSTTPSWHKRRAVDPEWKTYAARMVVQTKAPVAPLFFAGQNGPLFQLASHVSLTLRLALLIYELHNKIGAVVPVGLGDAVPWEKVAAIKDRYAQTQYLRDITYALDAITEAPSRPGFRRRRSAPPPGVRVPGTARP
jgi:putative hemolysin